MMYDDNVVVSQTGGAGVPMFDPAKLNQLYERVYEADSFEELVLDIRDLLLDVLQAERVTVYERSRDGREIVSRFKTGDDIGIIRVPLSPTSIAGYVAMSQKVVVIDDAYDAEQLTAIHSQLRFDYSYDQVSGFLTRTMLTVPICFGDTLLGVLQIINRLGGVPFSEQDVTLAQQIAQVLAQRLCADRETTEGPWEYLVQENIVSRGQLEAIEAKVQESGGSIAQYLLTELNVTIEQIGQSLEQYYQVPFMGYDPDLELPEDLLSNLSRPFLVRNIWVPIAGDRDKAVILIDNPNDTNRIMEIQDILNAASYEFLVGLQEDILRYLGIEPQEEMAEIEAPTVNLDELLHKLDAEQRTSGEGEIGGEGELVDENAATIVQVVNRLIADAVEINASDIHVEPGKGSSPGSVRMRVDGVCRRTLEIPAAHMRYVVTRIKIMSKLDIAESRLPQDGKITCRLYGSPLELRVATVPTVNGESVVMRVLAAGDPLPYNKLNLAPKNSEMVKRMIEHPHGLILVVGPTGSGKTTTLHAVLALINTPERKILTAEDPVEITQPGLQQLQIQRQIGLDFARALRCFLRADPDVILIGEMRDLETAHSGIEASLTGHLVFSTLHTNSAPETITRLLDMGLDPLNFADALVGVVAQRLCRTLCKECKEQYQADAEEVARLQHAYGEKLWPEIMQEMNLSESDLSLFRPKGCEACSGTGYKGRTGIHEVIEKTEELNELIVKRSTAHEIHALATQQNMRTLMQDGVRKVLAGQVDFKMLRAVTVA